jgi:hypothetical protein
MNLQMDLLNNPLRTRPIQTGREMSMELYPNRQFGFIDNPDRQSGSASVPTRTGTRSDGPDPLLTLDLKMGCNLTPHLPPCEVFAWRDYQESPQSIATSIYVIQCPRVLMGSHDTAEADYQIRQVEQRWDHENILSKYHFTLSHG